MARKITEDAIHAFNYAIKFNRDNTVVEVAHGFVKLRLHGHCIAQREIGSNTFEITNCGYFTVTTKERLNGLPGVSVVQRKGVWYLNGEMWDGSWATV